MSPLLVLEILQNKPMIGKSGQNLKFKVIKKYLLGRLEVQDKEIRKKNELVTKNMDKIKQMRSEIKDLKT